MISELVNLFNISNLTFMVKGVKLTVVAMNLDRRSSILLKNHGIHRIEDEPTLDMNNFTPRVPILKQSFS